MGKKTVAEASCSDQDLRNRLVWVDCEMTALDLEKDTLLEVAAIVTDKNLKIVAEGPNIVIHHPDSVLDSMTGWPKEQHEKSGLTKACRESKIDMNAAQSQLLAFVREYAPIKGACPLAGNSIGQDAKFLVKYMPEFMDHLHYRVVDVSTIKELARRWYGPSVLERAPPKKGSHRALDDILASIEELRYYRTAIFKL